MADKDRTGPTPSRRAVLASVLAAPAAVALGGCTADSDPPLPPDPDDLLRAAAVERERSLLQEYDAVLLVLPALAPRLSPLRAQHAEHLAVLLDPASPSPAASSAATPPPEVPPPPTAAAALTGLVAAERAAADAHATAALEASRELAGLLAALAASEHSHPVELG